MSYRGKKFDCVKLWKLLRNFRDIVLNSCPGLYFLTSGMFSLFELSNLHIKQIFLPSLISQALSRVFLTSRLVLEQALDLLVPVSFVHLCTSTSGLSPRSLQGVLLLADGISLLEVGFTLRCLQRLSFPDLATLLCIWSATDPPAVCPFRSSRTKNSSSQISYAHDG